MRSRWSPDRPRQRGHRRFPLGAHGCAKPSDLGEAACEQRALGIVARLKAIENARGKGDDVFGRPGQLDAEQIIVGIDAEPVGGERILKGFGQRRVIRGCAHGGGQAAGEFTGDRRAGHSRERAGTPHHVGDDLGRAQDGLLFDALGDRGDGRVGLGVRREALPDVADVLGGDGADDEVGIVDRLGLFGGEANVIRQRIAGQVSAVFTGLDQLGDVIGERAPDGDAKAFAVQEQGADGGHGAIADDGNMVGLGHIDVPLEVPRARCCRAVVGRNVWSLWCGVDTLRRRGRGGYCGPGRVRRQEWVVGGEMRRILQGSWGTGEWRNVWLKMGALQGLLLYHSLNMPGGGDDVLLERRSNQSERGGLQEGQNPSMAHVCCEESKS